MDIRKPLKCPLIRTLWSVHNMESTIFVMKLFSKLAISLRLATARDTCAHAAPAYVFVSIRLLITSLDAQETVLIFRNATMYCVASVQWPCSQCSLLSSTSRACIDVFRIGLQGMVHRMCQRFIYSQVESGAAMPHADPVCTSQREREKKDYFWSVHDHHDM